jgi:PAS domain S-box-containing protein
MKQKMQQVDENYRLLFERNPDGVFSLDPNGRFILVNPACEAISGYPSAELLGKTFMELCAPDCLTTAVSAFFEGIKSRNYTQIEITLIRKDRRRIDLLISGEPFYRDEKIATIYCTAKDITERKRMEDELRRTERRDDQGFSRIRKCGRDPAADQRRTARKDAGNLLRNGHERKMDRRLEKL